MPGAGPESLPRQPVDISRVLGENQSVRQTGFFKEAEMTTRDVERIRFVTQHFNELQGLRTLVPLGLIVLGLGATSFFRSWPLVLLQIVLTVVAAALIFRLGPYYRRTFGEVERRPASLGLEMGSLSIYNPAGPGLGIVRRPLITFLRLYIPAILAFALGVIYRAVYSTSVLSQQLT